MCSVFGSWDGKIEHFGVYRSTMPKAERNTPDTSLSFFSPFHISILCGYMKKKKKKIINL
jgi:hypothetical protein